MLEIFAADNIHLMETLPSQGVDIKRELNQIWMENFECKMSFHILYSAWLPLYDLGIIIYERGFYWNLDIIKKNNLSHMGFDFF